MSEDSLKLLVPAVLGDAAVCSTIQRFYDACLNEVRHGPTTNSNEALEALALSQSEYVLPPFDPLLSTTSDTPYSLFDI